jgi:C1A family cysteine protease
MLVRIVLSLVLLATTVSASIRGSVFLQQEPQVAEFDSWALQHGKEYGDPREAVDRYRIWKENDERIQAHNNQVPPPKFTLGHNEYSDMTLDEFHQQFSLGKYSNGVPPNKKNTVPSLEEDSMVAAEMSRRLLEQDSLQLPDFVNWIAVGGVTPVKNQGACGSCWAFSTTGALEGAKFVKTGELVALSEQNLLDCDHKDLGCNGGLMDNAFKFDEKEGGLCSEADYPYTAKQGPKCLTNCTDVPGSIVKTFVDVPPGNVKALLSAIALQPVSIAVQANQFAFQFYKNGVIDDDTCGQHGDIDHGVLAVGYATDLETQTPYWLVKNSWGPTWGDNGYLKMSRNSTNEFGMCAILKMASFPIVE